MDKKCKDCIYYKQYHSNTNEIIVETINYLNKLTGRNFQPDNKATVRNLNARIKEGYTLEDFKKVIELQVGRWMGTKWQFYLRPITLFRPSKFEGYLNQCVDERIKPLQNLK